MLDRMEYLLLSTKGEKYAKEQLSCMTHKDVLSGDLTWEKATVDYSFDPFGKLIKQPARILPNGTVFEHKKHYHGWFGLLQCTKSFYERNLFFVRLLVSVSLNM